MVTTAHQLFYMKLRGLILFGIPYYFYVFLQIQMLKLSSNLVNESKREWKLQK